MVAKPKTRPAAVKAAAKAAPPKIIPVKVPIWKAKKNVFLIDAVEKWAKRAGYQLIVEHRGDWKFGVSYNFQGAFKDNLKEVVKGFGSTKSAPVVVIYSNKVIKIGARVR